MSKSKKVATQRRSPGELLLALKEVQAKTGYVSEQAMVELASSFGIPLHDVYGVASFYSFLTTRPVGRNVIKVCKSLPCYLKNYQSIVEAIEREIGIKPGETTSDGRFSFELVNCIGLCDQAPAILINDDPHVNLTPGKIAKILEGYK